MDHLPSRLSSASRWLWVIWPRRWTKLRMWVAPGLWGAWPAGRRAAWVASDKAAGAPAPWDSGVLVFIAWIVVGRQRLRGALWSSIGGMNFSRFDLTTLALFVAVARAGSI